MPGVAFLRGLSRTRPLLGARLRHRPTAEQRAKIRRIGRLLRPAGEEVSGEVAAATADPEGGTLEGLQLRFIGQVKPQRGQRNPVLLHRPSGRCLRPAPSRGLTINQSNHGPVGLRRANPTVVLPHGCAHPESSARQAGAAYTFTSRSEGSSISVCRIR